MEFVSIFIFPELIISFVMQLFLPENGNLRRNWRMKKQSYGLRFRSSKDYFWMLISSEKYLVMKFEEC